MSERVAARLIIEVQIEVNDGADPTAAVGAVLAELVDHVDMWEPDIDGPHPDAVAWPEGGTAGIPRAVNLGAGAGPAGKIR